MHPLRRICLLGLPPEMLLTICKVTFTTFCFCIKDIYYLQSFPPSMQLD